MHLEHCGKFSVFPCPLAADKCRFAHHERGTIILIRMTEVHGHPHDIQRHISNSTQKTLLLDFRNFERD